MAVPPASALQPLERLGRTCLELLYHVSVHADDTYQNRLDNIDSRFRIWAGAIGLTGTGVSGIDYKFRDDATAADVLESMLRSLSRHLQRLSALRAFDVSYATSNLSGSAQGSSDQASTNSSSEDSYALDDDDTSASTGVGTASPFLKELQTMEDIIDQLYRVLKLVKTTNIAGEYSRITKFSLENATKFDDSDYASSIRFIIKLETPNASSVLVERFVSAAVYRRWKLLYKQERARQLNDKDYRLETVADGDAIGDTTKQSGILHGDENASSPAVVGSKVAASRNLASTATSTWASTAKKPPVPIPTRSIPRTLIPTSGMEWRPELDLPDPPKVDQEMKALTEAVCPYCAQVVKTDLFGPTPTDRSNWQGHIIRDCSPYVCLFEACNSPTTRQYSEINEWLQHMLSSHAQRYACKVEGHQKAVYEDVSDFEAHLSAAHNQDPVAAETKDLVQKALVPSNNIYAALCAQHDPPTDDKACLLCGYLFDCSTIKDENTLHHSSLPQTIKDHLSSHFERLAVLALPSMKHNRSRFTDLFQPVRGDSIGSPPSFGSHIIQESRGTVRTESEETIQARKEVAKGHLKRNWRTGMKKKGARALLSAHAKSIADPTMYECVFQDDPDFLGDILVEIFDDMTRLTAATLEENDRSFRGERSIAISGSWSWQDPKSLGNSEEPEEVPSYDEEEFSPEFNVVFLHPDHATWQFLRARNCEGRGSFISSEAVSQYKLASCTKTINGVPTVELTCRPCGQGSGSHGTSVTSFRIVQNDKLTNDIAVGSDAWRVADTPLHSDSGFNESESAESVVSFGREDRALHLLHDHDQQDIFSRIGRLAQDSQHLGAYMAYEQPPGNSVPPSTKPGSMQLPSKSKPHAHKGD